MRDGSVYYWHVHTRQTQWDPPKDDEGKEEHFDSEDKGNRLTISWQFSAYEIVPGARRRVLLRALCVRAPPAVARLALVTVLAASNCSEGAELIDLGSSYATFMLASLALVWVLYDLGDDRGACATDHGRRCGDAPRAVRRGADRGVPVPQIMAKMWRCSSSCLVHVGAL